jgi:hypothetical protein
VRISEPSRFAKSGERRIRWALPPQFSQRKGRMNFCSLAKKARSFTAISSSQNSRKSRNSGRPNQKKQSTPFHGATSGVAIGRLRHPRTYTWFPGRNPATHHFRTTAVPQNHPQFEGVAGSPAERNVTWSYVRMYARDPGKPGLGIIAPGPSIIAIVAKWTVGPPGMPMSRATGSLWSAEGRLPLALLPPQMALLPSIGLGMG